MIEMMRNQSPIRRTSIEAKGERIVDLIVMFPAKVEMIESKNRPDTTVDIEETKNKDPALNPAQVLLQTNVTEIKKGKEKRRRGTEVDQENIVDIKTI